MEHLQVLQFLLNKNKKYYIFSIYTLKGNFGSLAKVILNFTRFFDIFNRRERGIDKTAGFSSF